MHLLTKTLRGKPKIGKEINVHVRFAKHNCKPLALSRHKQCFLFLIKKDSAIKLWFQTIKLIKFCSFLINISFKFQRFIRSLVECFRGRFCDIGDSFSEKAPCLMFEWVLKYTCLSFYYWMLSLLYGERVDID